MAGAGRPPKMHLDVDDLDEVARYAADRLWCIGSKSDIWLTADKGVVVRRSADTTRGTSQLVTFVGQFPSRCRPSVIAEALKPYLAGAEPVVAEDPESTLNRALRAMPGIRPVLMGFPPMQLQEAA